MKTVGWIGTGQMGAPMVKNLLQGGFTVIVHNRTPEKAQHLEEIGAKLLQSPAAVVQQSDIIFLMLSNGSAIREVMTAREGILSAMQPGKVIIDMSTIAPEDSKAFAGQVSEKGSRYIDAPVSGSVGAAQMAQLVILAGATKTELAPYQPFFDVLGKNTIAFGGLSKGSSAKLAINLLLAVTVQGLAETLLLAEKGGIEQEQMLELISQSSMNSGLFQVKKEMYHQQSFPAAFMLDLMAKDLGLITEEAKRLGLDLPLAQKTHSAYVEAQEHGKGKLDMAAVYLELKEKNAALNVVLTMFEVNSPLK